MSEILIVYSTTDGQTAKISAELKRIIEESGAGRVTLADIKDDPMIDPSAYDKIVVGGSIRYGKHSPLIADFIRRNSEKLDRMPNAFFSVNVVARKPEKSRPENNPYLLKFLRRISWKPRRLAVFAGRLDYPKYGFLDRLMIRLIMKMTGGPTAPDTVIEYTDWKAVEEFGKLISEK